jgi:membrane fusion protein
MTTPLFRMEALNARSGRWTGRIVLARPVPMRVAAWVSATLVAALVVFAVVGEYTRSVRVSGQLVPAAGTLKAVAPQFGRVTHKRVHDGEAVRAGQVLYELSSERASDGDGIDRRIEMALKMRGDMLTQERDLQTRQLQERERSLSARSHMLGDELARLDQELVLQKARVDSAARMAERFRGLRQQGFVSEVQLTQSENDLSDQQSRLQSLERARLASSRDLVQLREEGGQVAGQIRLNGAQTERAMAMLEQEAAEHQGRSRIQVLAPADGTVTALAAEPGQTVQAGTVLASVIPAGSDLEAHLLVPSRAVGFIEQGQDVRLRLSAFPYQKFGQATGTVLRVEHSPLSQGTQPDGTAASQQAGNETMYRVVVRLARQTVLAYGRDQPYRAGMTLDADIRQDRRRLVEWVIDPLLSAAKGHAGS